MANKCNYAIDINERRKGKVENNKLIQRESPKAVSDFKFCFQNAPLSLLWKKCT
jgi:hypothetical protein